MTQVNYSSSLSNRCGDNNFEGAVRILRQHKDLNLAFGNTPPFTRTIRNACDIKQTEEYRNDALKILSALLDYYSEQKLSGDHKSEEYKKAFDVLEDILVDANKSFPFTDAVKAIVRPYWSDEEEEENEVASERDEDFDDDAYGSLDNIHNDHDLPHDDVPLPLASNAEWPEHLLHHRHLGGVVLDHTTES